ncbi:hypothetical protein GCM10017600_75110 [Streptosporangium carneum]|uniref:Uncharacterized protein n=1 Tax=Streptosporangium carneum TaxID=47481 RepID=A0A9W6IAG2_9ACTN|nr:hypothetical protein GCM10017600_75110 [Streptosporangium carneum]
MALGRLAREFAAEIANHDWSDATERLDRAGHKRDFESGRELWVSDVRPCRSGPHLGTRGTPSSSSEGGGAPFACVRVSTGSPL